ncbi:MAG: hypothetical protein O3A06_12245, partial [Proteobacteria bacterium]|nr:hypothetical protein [Pseudomonadota bacterium]
PPASRSTRYPQPGNLPCTGARAAAVPTGLHEDVPIGVQIIGPRFREDLCLDAAQVIENATGVLTARLP